MDVFLAARMTSASAQDVVTMQRPLSRSVSIDRPMQPSICWVAGITSLRVKAMPASRLSGSALMVVDRACMPPHLPLVAAPRWHRHWRLPWL
ncbi:hypothetical protein ACI79P_04610 [Blastococcus sp. SYSU DS0510]